MKTARPSRPARRPSRLPTWPPTLSALSGPTAANFGATKHYTFSITDPGTLDTFSVATSSGGTQATLSNLTIDNTTRTGGFDATFTGGSGSTTLSLQVKDQDGNLSNVSTLTVSLVNVFQVIGFQTTPSGFDATFNRAPVLSDVNLYDGVDVPDDLPDVVLHAVATNTDVRGSLVWNGTTNTHELREDRRPAGAGYLQRYHPLAA